MMGGCGARLPNLSRLAPLPSGPVCRVAVLPFASQSDYPASDAIAYKVFSSELSQMSTYLTSQEGDIRALYRQYKIFPWQEPTQEQLKILAGRLDAQLLIVGTVTEMREDRVGKESVNPVVALQLQILDGRTAKTLWSTFHRRQGLEYQKALHFGMIHSVSDLCRQVSLEIINVWFDQGLTRCDILP